MDLPPSLDLLDACGTESVSLHHEGMAQTARRLEETLREWGAAGPVIAVSLREVLGAKEFANEALHVPLALGKDVGGAPVIVDLAEIPHLLLAGGAGSGKSVCLRALILSCVYRAHPRDVRLLLIDPQRVGLSVYTGLPHLADAAVVDPKVAVRCLNRVVSHMEDRYKPSPASGRGPSRATTKE